MNPEIHSLQQLRAEIRRLSDIKKNQEASLIIKTHLLADSLRPENLVKTVFSSLTRSSELKQQVTSFGADATIGYLFSNVILKNANPMLRAISTYAAPVIFSYFFGDESGKYLDKFKNLISRFRRKDKNGQDETFDEKDIYSSGE